MSHSAISISRSRNLTPLIWAAAFHVYAVSVAFGVVDLGGKGGGSRGGVAIVRLCNGGGAGGNVAGGSGGITLSLASSGLPWDRWAPVGRRIGRAGGRRTGGPGEQPQRPGGRSSSGVWQLPSGGPVRPSVKERPRGGKGGATDSRLL